MSGSSATAAPAASTPAAAPVPVDEFIDADKAVADVAINESELNDEFIRQPGLVFYYTAMKAKSERQLSSLKLRLEAREAQVATKVRTDAQAAGEKITEGGIAAKVRLHPTVIQLDQAIIKAKEVDRVIDGVISALRDKKDMLVMRGHMTRDEIKARLSVEEPLAAQIDGSVRGRDAQIKERLAKQD